MKWRKKLFLGVLAASMLLSGCGKEEEAGLQSLMQHMKQETPAYSQEEFEAQLTKRLNEYLYYEGGIVYDDALEGYKGEVIDYLVLHREEWDEAYDVEDGDLTHYVTVILSPKNEKLRPDSVGLYLYDDTLYYFENEGFYEDLSVEEVESAFGGEKVSEMSYWYTGTITVGKGEEPEYPDFDGKEEKISDIEEGLKTAVELGEDDVYYIRDFREDDSSTWVLVEREDTYLWVYYAFYGDVQWGIQQEYDMNDSENEYLNTYIEKIKNMAVN